MPSTLIPYGEWPEEWLPPGTLVKFPEVEPTLPPPSGKHELTPEEWEELIRKTKEVMKETAEKYKVDPRIFPLLQKGEDSKE